MSEQGAPAKGTSPADADDESAPRRKRRRRSGRDPERKREARNQTEDGRDSEPLEPERASPFYASYPQDPQLAELVAAFERGDYRAVRRDAQRVADEASSDDVRRAALELRQRIDPDFVSTLLVALAAILLVVLAVYYWTQAQPHVHAP